MNNTLPLVCVCVPAYNAEATIVETLASIQKQTYENIEIHVFDNASSDHTVELVKSIADDRIHLHCTKKTGTAESNFTRCLNLVRGDYTAIFHADDLYMPDMIEKEVQFLELNQGAGGVLTFAHLINEQSQRTKTAFAPACLKLAKGESGCFALVDLVKAVLRENNFFFCPSALIRTTVCMEVLNEWRGQLFGPGADLDAWFRIAEAGKLGLINLPLLQYRVSTSHFSHAYNKLKTDRADLFTILDYWMKKPEVAQCLDAKDLHWYQKWLMRDYVVRANNAVRQGELKLAKTLLHKVSFGVFLKDTLTSWRGLKFGALFLLTLVKCRL